MDRRGFLKKLFGAAVATAAGVMVLDPEAALWRPGARLISIPAPQTFKYMDGFYVSSLAPSGGFVFSQMQDPDRWPGEIRVITKADPRDVAALVRLEFLMDAPDAPRRQLIQPCGPRS